MFEISPAEWTAILLSLRVAIIATLVATPFGIALAWLLARREFWGKSILDALVHLPLVLPPVVTGYLLLISFGKRGPIGAFLDQAFGIVFSFRWTGAALAAGGMGFPLMVRRGRHQCESRRGFAACGGRREHRGPPDPGRGLEDPLGGGGGDHDPEFFLGVLRHLNRRGAEAGVGVRP